MANEFSQAFADLNFYEVHQVFLDNSYYSVLFPFLLVFALLYTALSYVSIFKSKKTGEPYTAIITIVSILISWYGVAYELSPGRSVGFILMTLFPNISALTIGILGLYIMSAIFGLNFFRGLFSKRYTSFIYIACGGLGLASVLFYIGIAMGFWDYQPFDQTSYWNFAIAAFLLVLGIVFLFVDLEVIGIIFLIIVGIFIYNSGEDNILEYFLDPVIFIIILVMFLVSWLSSDKDKKSKLAYELNKGEDFIGKFGSRPKDYENRIHDIVDTSYELNKKKWNQLHGNDNWRR